jgi:hypothetical protein
MLGAPAWTRLIKGEIAMIRTVLSSFALLALAATPALANHCPQDAAAIDHALPLSSLSDEAKAAIQALRDEGMAAHEAGDHAQSEALLADAMRQLLLAQE